MKKVLSVASFLLFVFINVFIFSDHASAASTTNIVGSGASGSTISSISVNGRIGSASPATFNVSVSCSNCTNQNDWTCDHTSAAADGIESVGIDRAEVSLKNSGSDYDYYSVVIYPSDYSTATNECPYDNSKNGGPGYHKCYIGHQSIRGTVKVPKGSSSDDTSDDTDDDTPPPPPPPPSTTTETTTTTDTYYLRVYYKRYGTENLLNCISSPEVQGSYEVVTTTTTTTTTTYNSDGTVASTETSTETTKSTPATAYATYSTFVCGNEYRYKTSSGLGPFTMDHDVDVSLYYEQAHKLTVNPRRIVGYSTMCNAGPWTNVYFDTDDRYQYGVGAWNSISCSTGTYDFYEYRDHNNAISSGQNAYANDTHYDSSATAIYRRRNTLTLKHVNFYNRNGDLIAGDQSATVHDYENATINPVSNGFSYGGYEYQLYGYANSRNGTVVPNTNRSYTEYNMTSDVTRWAFYKKVLYLTIIPVDTNGNRLANNLVARVLEGDSASVKTYTTIGNYTFKGFGADWHNPGFPGSYVYTVPEMHDHVNIYAVYETSDSLTTDCPPSGSNFVQSYVRNTRFDSTTWSRNTTYAKLGDTISYCTGYNNKYPYWNFMYPDYEYLVSYGRFSNPGRAIPLGYQNNLDQSLKNQLYSTFTVTSNRSSLQYVNNLQLSFTQNRDNQQKNFKSTKRSTIKNYPTKINDNRADVGLSTGVYEQGHINYDSMNTSTSYIGDQNKSTPFTITSLPRAKKDAGTNETARAIFPYNFKNTSTIDDKGRNHYVYAGGTTTLNVNLIVNPKSNAATHTEIGGNYATVDEGDIYYRIEVSVSDGSIPTTVTSPIRYNTAGGSNPINSNNKAAGDSAKTSKQIYVPDVNPGVQVCFRSSVWPKDSDKDGTGTSTNKNGGYSSVNEAGSWSDWGPQVCYKAASKPTVQAWGGNVIANGQINTSYITKYHLYPNTYYPLGSYSETHTFGSWGELGIIANQNTYYMASGASLAYPQGMVGSSSVNFSNFVPLTFANYNPLTGTVVFGNLQKTYTTSEQTFDKSSLVSKYIYSTDANTGSSLSINQGCSNNPAIYHAESNVCYYRSDSDLTIGTSNPVRNVTQVVHTKDKNIRISGNIIYENGYTTLENIPKLIIYAEGGTISIDYNVARVDAILIADTIITCSKESGCTLPSEAPKASSDPSENNKSVLITNPRNKAVQLSLNGTLIAKKVIPNRTYGAGRGANNTYNDGTINSITPAEIINYDTSLYRWEQYSRQDANSTSPNASLTTTYVKEVAPRY